MFRIKTFTLQVIFLLCISFALKCECFASWFMTACFTDLWDTSEVIMGHTIIPYEQSTQKDNVFIKIFDTKTKEEISTVDASSNNVIDNFQIDPSSNVIVLNDLHRHALDDGSMKYNFLVKVLVESVELKDFQFVLDSKVIPVGENLVGLEEEDDDSYADVLSDGNEDIGTKSSHDSIARTMFASYKNGCGQKRSYGTHKDNELKFSIKVPKSTLMREGILDKAEALRIQLLAGWACGREAVQLTKPVDFFLKFNEDFENETISRHSNVEGAEL